MPATRPPHEIEIRAAAEMLYVIERRSRKETIDQLALVASTFDRWRKKGRWDERRSDAIVSIPEIVRMMKEDVKRSFDLAAKEERPLNAGERDGIHKTISKMQQLDKGSLFSQHGVQVMDLFSTYLKEHAPGVQPTIVEHIVGFTRRLAATPLV